MKNIFVLIGLLCCFNMLAQKQTPFDAKEPDCITCAQTCFTVQLEDTDYSQLILAFGGGSTQFDILACLGTASANFTFQAAEIQSCIQDYTEAGEVSVTRISDLAFELKICRMPEGAEQPLWIGGERENRRFNQSEEEEVAEVTHFDQCTLDALDAIFNQGAPDQITCTEGGEECYEIRFSMNVTATEAAIVTALDGSAIASVAAGQFDEYVVSIGFVDQGGGTFTKCVPEEDLFWLDANGNSQPSLTDYQATGGKTFLSISSVRGWMDGISTTPLIEQEADLVADKYNFSTVCKPACVKGIGINVTIAYDRDGNVLWYRDEAGNVVDSPDFQADCGPLTCETTTPLLCADEDNAGLGITTGDELMVTIRSCSDGSNTILSASLLTSLGTSFTLPAGFTFQPCAGSTTASVIRCVLDEDGNRWREILINGASGITIVYQNEADNTFGTPTGDVTDCSTPVLELVSAIDGKHCIQIGETEFKAFLFVNSDKTICAKPVGGTTVYQEGEYTLVSCCPATEVETVHFPGFTVTRDADTPNLNWDNEKTSTSLPLTGDFDLCFTVLSATPNTPQMLGITTDPTANASYNTIDHAMYLYNAGTNFLLREYQNGVYIINYNNLSWIGSEICFERIGANLYYKQNGVILNPSTPCVVGTGPVFLDDSHYYRPGFWSSGSITYSDFTLKTVADDDIKSVDECCCEAASAGGGMSSLNVTKENTIVGFASGDQFLFTTNQARNSSVTRTAQGRYTVTFSSPHPDGVNYEVLFGQQEEFANRDVVKVSVEEGTKTATGFSVQVTTDDNGPTGDVLTDEPFSYFVPYEKQVVTDVSLNP